MEAERERVGKLHALLRRLHSGEGFVKTTTCLVC